MTEVPLPDGVQSVSRRGPMWVVTRDDGTSTFVRDYASPVDVIAAADVHRDTHNALVAVAVVMALTAADAARRESASGPVEDHAPYVHDRPEGQPRCRWCAPIDATRASGLRADLKPEQSRAMVPGERQPSGPVGQPIPLIPTEPEPSEAHEQLEQVTGNTPLPSPPGEPSRGARGSDAKPYACTEPGCTDGPWATSHQRGAHRRHAHPRVDPPTHSAIIPTAHAEQVAIQHGPDLEAMLTSPARVAAPTETPVPPVQRDTNPDPQGLICTNCGHPMRLHKGGTCTRVEDFEQCGCTRARSTREDPPA